VKLFKELLQIILAIFVFQDIVDVVNIVGIAMTFFGIIAYHLVRYKIDLGEQAQGYDPVQQAEIELSSFECTVDEDDELSDGWDDLVEPRDVVSAASKLSHS
jgi:hypothetical protein